MAAFVKLLKPKCVTKSWGAHQNLIDASRICCIFPTHRSHLSMAPYSGCPNAAMNINSTKYPTTLRRKDSILSKFFLIILAGLVLLQTNPDEEDFEKMLKEWYYCVWPVNNPNFLRTIQRKDYVLFSTFTVNLDSSGKRKASFMGFLTLISPYGKNGTGIGGDNCGGTPRIRK